MIELMHGLSKGRIKRHINFPFSTLAIPAAARSNYAGGIYNDTLILLGGNGGNNSSLGQWPTQIERVNLTNNASSYVSMGHTYTWCGGVVVGKFIYYADGHTGVYSNTFRRIDVSSTNASATTLASTPGPNRHSSLLLHDNGNIYRVGGFDGSTGKPTNHFSVYNIATNKWTELASMPHRCNGLAGYIKDNKLVITVGWADDIQLNLNYFLVYDIATGVWSKKSAFARLSRSWMPCVVIGDYLYQATFDARDAKKMAIRKFDTRDLSAPWSELIMNTNGLRWVSGMYHDANRDRVLIVGGAVSSPGTANYDNLPKQTGTLAISVNDLKAA